jgi:hypothetical protein
MNFLKFLLLRKCFQEENCSILNVARKQKKKKREIIRKNIGSIFGSRCSLGERK